MAHLEQAVQGAANRYLKQLPSDPDHPFPGAVPDRHQLTMWAVVMETAGHQLPHIHPAAWLSGVYYAERRQRATHPQILLLPVIQILDGGLGLASEQFLGRCL